MKKLGLIILLFICIVGNAQNNDLSKTLQTKNDNLTNCEIISFNALTLIAQKLEQNQMDSVEIITKEWINLCDTTELSERLLILSYLLKQQDATPLIIHYTKDEYSLMLFESSIEYQDFSISNRYYNAYDYRPFKPMISKIDSILMLKAQYLLDYHELSLDEKLICTLFLGNIKLFKKKRKQKEYYESTISQQYIENKQKEADEMMRYSLHLGTYQSLNSKKIFGTNPSIGLSSTFSLKNKFNCGLNANFRININDTNFIFAPKKDSLISINSDYSFSLIGFSEYEFYKINDVKFSSKIGGGYETISAYNKNQQNEEKYHNVHTAHFTLSLSVMKRVFIKNYVGLEFSYHYCPYEFDKKLITKLDNNALGFQTFFMF